MGKCDVCALRNIANGGCPIFQADMSGNDGCPYFAVQLDICEMCGAPIIGGSILDKDENEVWHIMCKKCAAAPKCATCVNRYCAFENDTSCKEPPMIMVQKQQGNILIQQQVMNPKRVEATCRQGCPCFDEEGLDDGSFCTRQFGCGCQKYHTNWRK